MLLSICIPTYNRGEYLRQTLRSIVSQAAWDGGKNVEITISDNCSTDDTPAIVAEFQQHGAAIRYVHLEQAIDPHDNFASALDLGQGKFLKLQNDTCLWQPGALGKFLELAERFADVDLILTPNSGGSDSAVRCDSMDETLSASSFYLTWIGTFAISNERWRKIDDPMRCRDLRLPQVDLVARVMSSGGTAVVCPYRFYQVQEIGHRVNYPVAEVFCKNYFSILVSHISPEVLQMEKKRLLNDYLIRRHFDFFREYNSTPQKGYWQNTRIYHRDILFYISFIKVAILYLISRFFDHEQLRRLKGFIQRRKMS